MKKFSSLIAVLILSVVATGLSCFAADLNDHELYKIVTYSYNNINYSDEMGAAKRMDRFEPLMITRTKADLIIGQPNQMDFFPFSTGKKLVQSFAISADFHATSRLALHGVLGVTKRNMDTSPKLNFDSSWEANIGVIYKLFNNFSYEMHFGFMDTGDLFKNSAAYKDVENIVMLSNQLSMSF